MPAPYDTHRAQIKAILLAWGMPEDERRDRPPTSWPGPTCTAWTATASRCCPATTGCAATGARRWTRGPAIVTGDSGFRAGRWRRRAGPRAGAVRHADRDRQGEGGRDGGGRRCATPRISAPRGYYTLMAARGGADRHGLHLGVRHSGGADVRQAGAAGHRSVVVRGAWRGWQAVSAGHGDHTVAAGRIRNKANEGLQARRAGC